MSPRADSTASEPQASNKQKRANKVLRNLKFNQEKDRVMKDPQTDDIVIPIMGPTGAGKSSFINILMGKGNMKIGPGLKSCTQYLHYAILDGSKLGAKGRIIILDTPGFDDTFETDYEILRRISVWLTHSYSASMQLAGVIYLHDISQTRMLGSTRKNFELFRTMCGLKASPHILLTTTKWDRVKEDEGTGRETQLKQKFWNGLLEQKAMMRRFTRTQQSAVDIIQQVVSAAKLADPDVDRSLAIQQELYEIQKHLPQTDAGHNLRSSLKAALDGSRAMERQLKGGEAENAPPELKKEYEDNQKQIQEILRQLDDLKIPLSRQIMALFGLY